MNRDHVVVVGAGVVGLATGQVLEEIGHVVSYVDRSPERCALLRADGHRCTETIELGADASVILLCVPTPTTGEGHDLGALVEASRAVGTAMATSAARHLVATRSTVPPQTTEQLVQVEVAQASGLVAGEHFDVGSAPEFLRQETALEDSRNPRVVVTAARDPEARERLATLFAPLGGQQFSFDDPTITETIKIVHNCYNAAKISFFNEIHGIAAAIGVDGDEIARVVVESAEAQYNPSYGTRGGYAFGGACLPKDLDGLIGFSTSNAIDVPLLEAVRQVNRTLMAGDR